MRKTKYKQLFIILALILLLYPSVQVQAKVQSFSSMYMEITIPDNIIILTSDTPDLDEQWLQAGISDPKAEKKTFSDMGVQAILYDPVSATTVRLLQNQSDESTEVFHLSLLSEDELQDFLNGLISAPDERTTYSIEKYPQQEIPFFRVVIDMKTDTSTAKEIIYGTVVNGDVISFDIYNDKTTDPIKEDFIKELVAGTHFTQYLDKAEVQKQGRRSMIVLVVAATVLIGLVLLFILLSARKNKKQAAVKKQKSAELAKFFKEQAEREAKQLHDPVLFTNRTLYTEEVVKQFCYYDVFFHHISRWIFTVIVFILLMLSFYTSGDAFIYYIIGAVLIFLFVFFQGLQIEKTIKKLMTAYNKNRSMEAVFTFHNDYYTLSGVQSSSKYPYIQITEVKEYKDYLYLYLGSDRALYMRKDGFDGNLAEFMKFIKEKTK